jgi:hypothetical protein
MSSVSSLLSAFRVLYCMRICIIGTQRSFLDTRHRALLIATVHSHLLTNFLLLCMMLGYGRILGLIHPLYVLRDRMGGYMVFPSGTLVERQGDQQRFVTCCVRMCRCCFHRHRLCRLRTRSFKV